MLFLPNLGMPEILMILVVALLVFGPKRLPEIGKSMGKAFREFRKSTSGFMDSINEDIQEKPKAQNGQRHTKPIAAPQPADDFDDTEATVIEVEPETSEEPQQK